MVYNSFMREESLNKYFYFLTKLVLFLGTLCIAAGIIFNPFFFERFLSYDGSLENSTTKLILIFQITTIVMGIFIIMISVLMKKSTPKIKEFIISLSFLFFTLLFFFVVTEIVVRFAFPTNELFSAAGTDPAVFQQSTLIPWTLKPNATAHFVALDFDTEVTINSLGLRDKNRTMEKDNDTYRILIVGDSFTYGFGVNNNESYPAVLESLLNGQASDTKFEVWNAGFASGYTEDTFYLYLREVGVQFNPDMIIVGLYVENDILDFLKNSYVFDDAGKLTRITSDFYHVENGKLRRMDTTEMSSAERAFFFAKKLFLRYSRAYSYFYNIFSTMLAKENNPIFDNEYSDVIEENFEKTKYYLGQIKELSVQNNITFAIILLPGKISSDELWENYLSKNPKSVRDKPEKILLSYCQEINVTCLNLWSYFTDSTDGEKYYFEHDAHWSKEGNQKGAEIIYELLLSENIVKHE